MARSESFDAPWDDGLRQLTLLSSAGVLGASALVAWMAFTQPLTDGTRGLVLVSALPGVAIFVLSALYAPRGYDVSDDAVRVRRWAGVLVIPMGAVQGIERLSSSAAIDDAVRTLGVGGLFGYFGRFRGRTLGAFRMYATRSSGLVLLRTTTGRIVLTPGSPERFVAAVERARAPRAIA